MASATYIVLCALFCTSYAANLGATCVTNEDCIASVENSVCDTNKLCSCADKYVANVEAPANTKCLKLPIVWPGVCEENIQCTSVFYGDVSCQVVEGATTKQCACAVGQHFLDGACWRTLALGDTCVNSNECYEEEFPDRVVCSAEKVCVCKAGYVEEIVENINKCVSSASQNGVGLVVLLSALFATTSRLIST